ncbi:MAG: right-handed parallel beta-helix repeat-containing protein, partial [Leadbetterella sp.]
MLKHILVSFFLLSCILTTQAQFLDIDEQNINEYFVDPNGSDESGTGTEVKPYKTLQKALGTALYQKRTSNIGCKIIVKPGIYRNGTPEDKYVIKPWFDPATLNSMSLIIEGAGFDPKNPKNTGDVIFRGSEDFSHNWKKNTDGTWSHVWPYNFGVPPKGNKPFGVSDAMVRREMMFLNGVSVYQVNPPNYVNRNGKVGNGAEGESSNPNNVNGGRLTIDEGSFWVQDAVVKDGKIDTMGVITISLPKNLPSDFDLNHKSNLVEVITKQSLMQIWLKDQMELKSNIILRNLNFEHASLPVAIDRQNNLLIEYCKFNHNKSAGLQLMGNRNIRINSCEFSFNGETGVNINGTSHLYAVNSKFNFNSRQAEIVGLTSWSVCGIKFFSDKAQNDNNVLFQCEAIGNRSTGFWWDSGNFNCRMIECVAKNNSSNGIFIENNNTPENNYENIDKPNRHNTGIPDLKNTYSVKVEKCVIIDNIPPPETRRYRPSKGRGVFFSENDKAILEYNIIS